MHTFKIGYDPDFAPISFRDARGEPDGVAIGRLAAACSAAGIDCIFVPVALGEQQHRLAEGEVDALAAVASTRERKAGLDLSPPYLETGAAWFSPAPVQAVPLDRAAFDPSAAPAGTRVTTPSAGPLLAILADRWPHLQIVPAASYRDALERVVGGEASAAALNIDAGRQMCRALFPGRFSLPSAPFLTVSLALACGIGLQRAVLARLSAALAAGNPGVDT